MTDNAAADATPAEAGATPAQITPVSPAAAPAAAEPATGDEAALGDAGKKALDAMKRERDAAQKAERELAKKLEAIESANQTEQEKLVTAARKEGESASTVKWQTQIRQAKVEAALTAAGISSGVLDLAAKGDEFSALEVGDDGQVTGLAEAVASFKKSRAALFTTSPAPTTGSGDLGTGGGHTSGRTFTRSQLKDATFFNANRAEIMAAMAEGRITE